MPLDAVLATLHTAALAALIVSADRYATAPGWIALSAIPFGLGLCVTLHSVHMARVSALHRTAHRSAPYHAVALTLFIIGIALASLPISSM